MLTSDLAYINSFKKGLTPDPVLTVSQWADKHRILSQVSSAEPGPYQTSRTPYAREIMDNLSSISPIQEIVWMKGAQVGATECGNNWFGYIIDHVPGPTMSVMPRLEDAKKNSKIRMQTLIDECERLRDKVKEPRARDSGNTILQKDFPGGTLFMTGANSPAGLRSMPVRYIFFDEEDLYPVDCGGEGDPISLAKKRTSTFAKKKKIFHVSTPTIEGRSRIEANYNLTDQRKYYMPCPKCKHFQWLQWQQIKWTWGKPETVYYECEECKHKIKNWQKTKMLAAGEWRATSESKNKYLIGYHLSSLYSPVGWLDWEDCAREWEEAKNSKNQELLKTFINTTLGESWKDKGEAPEHKKLYKRREQYEINSIPNGVCFLTAGVDIQKDRIEVEIVGWGRNKRSWSIDYRVFEGDTSNLADLCWIQLQDVLAEVWQTASGVDLPVRTMAVDSGYNTQTVYSWCRKFPRSKVMAIKGSDNASVILSTPRSVDIKKGKRKIRRAMTLYIVGVSIVKQELYGWLKMDEPEKDEPEPYGFCHFPEYDEEHFKRLTSETLETKWVKGHKRYEWVANGRNEQLDCRVYNRAAACLVGIDRFKPVKWDALELETCATQTPIAIKTERQEKENVQNLKDKPKKRKLKRRKSNFT